MWSRRMRSASLALLSVCFVHGLACDSKPESTTTEEPPKAGRATSKDDDVEALKEFVNKDGNSTRTPAALPQGHPPITPGGAGAAMPSNPPAGALKYDVPNEWQPQQVTSAMRKAQFGLPKVEGDSEDGQLIVFYFGRNEGGDVRSNLDRWKTMFTTADGAPVPDDKVAVEQFEANGLKVTLLDIAGRYADRTMSIGQAPDPTEVEYRMFASVVETPDGPWFFKAVGPSATMASHRDGMVKLLKSAKP